MKKTIAIIAIVVILAVVAWLIFYSEEETQDQELNQEEEVVQNENENEEDSDVEEDESEEDNPYATAETVEPVADINVEMNEDFRAVLGEVFEEEPKLVSTGDILILSYIVDRTITSDDVIEIRDLLEENDYKLEGTDTREDEYDLNFSAEILDEEYKGNIYVLVHTAEKGENAQKIEVRIL